MAVVSPMVSAAETRKITHTDRIAPMLNWGLNIRKCGSDTIPPDMMELRLTIPKMMDRI